MEHVGNFSQLRLWSPQENLTSTQETVGVDSTVRDQTLRVPLRQLRPPRLPREDNKQGSIKALLEFNSFYRENPWPEPFNRTLHRLVVQNACDMGGIPS